MNNEKTDIEQNGGQPNANGFTEMADTMPSFEKYLQEIEGNPEVVEMSKEQVHEAVIGIENREEASAFVRDRMRQLETTTAEKTVGQNYTDSFRDYIGGKIHYKAADRMMGMEMPDLVYDDEEPYVALVEKMSKNPNYDERNLFNEITFAVLDYFGAEADALRRMDCYSNDFGGTLSVKDIRDNHAAFCSERAGMAHNMFKVFGVASELVAGYRGNEPHAYTVVYPKGYDEGNPIIFDVSNPVKFYEGDEKTYRPMGAYQVLRGENKDKFLNGGEIQTDFSEAAAMWQKMYGSYFDGTTPKCEPATYRAGGLTENENG